MEDIYKNIDPKNAPWNSEEAPQALKLLLKRGDVRPCKSLEIGCGLGNYSIYLSKCGFNVTGIDVSASAIREAKKNARMKQADCTFVKADFLGDLAGINPGFDFVFDWLVLHHIFPEQRKSYAKNVNRFLNTGGKYVSVCFSEKNKAFGGKGKYRQTPLNTTLYFSSEQEIYDLYSPYFKMIDLKTIEIKGKPNSHLAIYAFMEK